MKYLLIVFVTLITFNTSNAQQWLTNFEDAKKQATEENKNILLVFSGSDWCAPCMKLKAEIMKKPGFEAYAKDALVIVNADFPRKKALKQAIGEEIIKQNDALAQKYNKKGYFPHVVLLKPTGEVIGRTGYKNMSPEDYAIHIKELAKTNE